MELTIGDFFMIWLCMIGSVVIGIVIAEYLKKRYTKKEGKL